MNGDAWGGALLILVGVSILIRTLRGTLVSRVLQLAGS